jgi:regulatory protein
MIADLEKIKHFCAYQERCHSEVRSRLLEMKVYGAELEDFMVILIAENFLNEERFARAFARGKFSLKQWGRIKIKHELKARNISSTLIQMAMKEIDEADYERTLQQLTEKKWETLRAEKNFFVKMNKLKNYLLQKGFEGELVYECVRMMG